MSSVSLIMELELLKRARSEFEQLVAWARGAGEEAGPRPAASPLVRQCLADCLIELSLAERVVDRALAEARGCAPEQDQAGGPDHAASARYWSTRCAQFVAASVADLRGETQATALRHTLSLSRFGSRAEPRASTQPAP